jgi:hypothetical protein
MFHICHSLKTKNYHLCKIFFYAPVSKDQGNIVFGLSVCLSVLSVCLSFVISFEWQVLGLSYFICVFLMTRPFYKYQIF